MNKKYEKEICPVCYAKFFEDDDVVVCPICGAPHHRDCYNSLGHCKYQDTHYTPDQWDKQKNRNSATERADAGPNDRVGITCPDCGAVSSSDTLFCPNCGTPFGKKRTEYATDEDGENNSDYAPAFNDPLGGVSAQESVDGVPIIEISSFVGPNSASYCPKFVKMKKGGRKVFWNWFAFLIPEYFFFYRKCYGLGSLALAIKLMVFTLMTPFSNILSSMNTNYADMYTNPTIPADTPPSILLFALIGYALLAASMVIFGLFGNYFYKMHCVEAIKNIKSNDDTEDIHEEISRRGGVTIWAPLVCFAVYQLLINIIVVLL